ncbi:disulfide bond formation protein B [Fodinicurvata sp. EGI_FJ10296]|uniref:disulfide bond formation protein B n=1 Tax=Fodinicurvata sp. EGI_FJ10296 TaxID=3231908 RepID=UPI0034534BC9
MSPGSSFLVTFYFRFAPQLLLAASIVVLGTAMASERWGGLLPCPLCLWQRWPYWVAIAMLLATIIIPGRDQGALVRTFLLTAVGITFTVGAGLGGYHVGVEQGWWPGLASCGATGPALQSGMAAEDLRQQLFDTPVVRCDRPAWTLFGISMAGYNMLVSAVLAFAALAAALVTSRRAARAAR